LNGIVSYGAYVPIYRLSRELIGKEWGTVPGRGEVAIASYDEDSLTMAVEAVLDCLKGFDHRQVDALYFASTTSPYREKQCASIIAAVADLRRDVYTADFGNSLRAGANALKAALDALSSGSAKQVLVVAADCRLPAPDSELEGNLGDGASAILLGSSDTIANIEGSYSVFSESMDVWRREQDHYPQTWEDRFTATGYVQAVQQAGSGLLRKHNLTAKDFGKLVCNGNARRQVDAASKLGFDTKTQLQDSMFDNLGDTGAAYGLMILVAALESAKAGDRILFLDYGDGCDAYLLHVTELVSKLGARRGVKRHLTSKMMLPSYGKYLRFRDMLEWQIERRPADRSALTVLERDRRWILPLMGLKCKSCGGIQYPVMGRGRVCTWCQVKDNMEEIKFSDKKGILFTYSMDERAMEVDLPNVLSVVDLEGGGRYFGQMTDRDPAKIEVGMPVELTFRKMHEGSGIINYSWKVRPVRG
jgi:3-hydroxy-3-methylglutaryl CoA synthase